MEIADWIVNNYRVSDKISFSSSLKGLMTLRTETKRY